MEKKMSKDIIEVEDVMMGYKVVNRNGDYVLEVKVPFNSVNEWNLGKNEEIAKSKVSTILTSYSQGLEYVQEQVRAVFAAEEQKVKESDQHTSA